MARKFRFLFVFLLIIFMADTSGCGAPKENLIKNPSFEDISNGNPAVWDISAFDPKGAEFKLEQGPAHSGQRFVTIISNTGNDARYKQSVPVSESKSYHLTAWAKTENVGDKGLGAEYFDYGKRNYLA